jgi:pimeloyl-ACP methyl ester carboxylesterase
MIRMIVEPPRLVLVFITLLSLVLVEGCASAPKPIEPRRPGESSMHIQETEVAFTVHKPSDPVPARVRGTVFYTQRFDPHKHRAVLLLHGGTLDRRFWDGFKIPGALRFAAELARQSDTAVFTVDRLGYGESPYDGGPGSGFKVTPDTNVETIHEIVAQIRKGSYEVLDGPVPPQGATGVVLGGQSFGAALIELYATRHQDIDGLMPFGWSNQMLPGASVSMFVKMLNEVVTPQLNAGADYIYFFPPEKTNYSKYCEQAVYHVPGVDPDILTQACANGLHNRIPVGEFIGVQPMAKEITANISKVGAIPVLFMFGRHDNMVPGPEWGGLSGEDVDVITPEIAHWRAKCKCKLSVYVIEDTSHDFPLHKSAESTVKEMSKWLKSF